MFAVTLLLIIAVVTATTETKLRGAEIKTAQVASHYHESHASYQKARGFIIPPKDHPYTGEVVPEDGCTYNTLCGFATKGYYKSDTKCRRETNIQQTGSPLGMCTAANADGTSFYLAMASLARDKLTVLYAIHYFSDHRCTVPSMTEDPVTQIFPFNQCQFFKETDGRSVYLNYDVVSKIPEYYVGTLLRAYNHPQDCRSTQDKVHEGLVQFAYFKHGVCNPEGWNPVASNPDLDFSVRCYIGEETFYNTFATTDQTCSSPDTMNTAIGVVDNDKYCSDCRRSLDGMAWGYLHYRCI